MRIVCIERKVFELHSMSFHYMKLYIVFGIIALGGIFHNAQAQVSPFPEATAPRFAHYLLYEEGLDLYEKKLYGAAREEFDQFIQTESEAGLRSGDNNDVHAYARYYQAMSAFFLTHNDAIELLENFAKQFPENTKVLDIIYSRGKYYFERRDYEKTIEALEGVEASTFTFDSEQEDELYFMLAYSYFSEKGNELANEDQAVRYFDRLTYRNNPYQEDALYYKAIILYRKGTQEGLSELEEIDAYEQAETALKRLKNSRKYGAETRLYLANTLLKLKKYQELFDLAEELTQDRTRNQSPELYHLVANASYDQDSFPGAIQYFQEFIRRNGKMSRVDFFRLGYAQYKEENYIQAIPALERVLGEADSLTRASSYYLGFAFINTDDLENAKYAFKKIIDKNGGYGRDGYGFPIQGDEVIRDAFFQYAKLAFATGDYDEARATLVEIEEYYPDAPFIAETRRLLGEVWVQNRNYLEAIKYFESIPLNDPRSQSIYQQALFYYGSELYEKKDYVAASTYFSRAVSNNYDNGVTLSARYWLAESAFMEKEYAQAARSYQDYLQHPGASNDRYFSAAHYGLGWTNFKQKSYSAAFNYFDQFTRMVGSRTPKRILVDAYLRAGDCLFLMRRYSQANAYYDKVSNLGYAFQDNALYQTAESYYRQRNYRQAVNTFETLIRDYVDSPIRDNALDRASEISITWLKEYRRGAQFANTLVTQYPNSRFAPDAYARLALAAYNTNNTNAAIQFFKKILEDYGQDKKNSELALNNLANLLPENEFDRILRDYRRRNPELNENLAALTFTTGMERYFAENYQSAISQFSDYINSFRNGPDYHEALLYRGRSYQKINQLSKALNDFERVYSGSKNDFTNFALLDAAEIYFQQKQFTKSMELFDRLLVTSNAIPNRVTALFGLAKNHRAMGNFELAQRELERIANDPEVDVDAQVRAKVEIGEGLYVQKRYNEATQYLQEVEQNFSNEYAAKSQYLLIQIMFAQGNYPGVIEGGKHMSNVYPTFNRLKAEAFLVVAEANYESGDIFQAKGVLQSLIGEDRFPDIQQVAQKRLQEIEAEEQTRNAQPVPPNNN